MERTVDGSRNRKPKKRLKEKGLQILEGRKNKERINYFKITDKQSGRNREKKKPLLRTKRYIKYFRGHKKIQKRKVPEQQKQHTFPIRNTDTWNELGKKEIKAGSPVSGLNLIKTDNGEKQHKHNNFLYIILNTHTDNSG